MIYARLRKEKVLLTGWTLAENKMAAALPQAIGASATFYLFIYFHPLIPSMKFVRKNWKETRNELVARRLKCFFLKGYVRKREQMAPFSRWGLSARRRSGRTAESRF